MKSKSEVRPLLVSFHKMIFTQFGVGFKAIHSVMPLSFVWWISLVLMALFIRKAMLTLRNKILLWRGSISTF